MPDKAFRINDNVKGGYNFEQFYFLDWRQEIVARADFTAVSRSRNIRPIH
nr:MAG TPA: hypothetical protein [Bacteriophage sp.]